MLDVTASRLAKAQSPPMAAYPALSRRPRLFEWYRAIRRVRTHYRIRHRRYPRLLRPRSYTEKMQWRKLFDLNPLFAVLSDRIAVRDFIAARVGGDYLVPLLWSGNTPEAAPLETIEPPYVVKSSCSFGQNIFVGRGELPDFAGIRTSMKGWLSYCHGSTMEEPAYVHVPRRFLIERQLFAPDGTPPVERRLFVFGGRVEILQARIKENGALRNFGFHTRAWEPLSWWMTRPLPDVRLEPPKRFGDLIALAERIGQGLDHVCVDVYDCGDRIWIGEITVYSWSGLFPFHPAEADDFLASYWTLPRPFLRALKTMLTRRREIRQSFDFQPAEVVE